jgi:Trypsin-like serine proteases, typically periplasmic, contain C-terminal PDZ domain
MIMRRKMQIQAYILLVLLLTINFLRAEVNNPLVRIPFTTNGRQTYLELQVNGSNEKLCFAFDTGAGGTAIDRNYLKLSNVVLTGEKEDMATSMNVVQVDISNNNKINFDGFEISGIKFYIESLAHLIPSPAGKQVAGIIGYDLMKNYVTYINHEENYIELYAKGTQLYPKATKLSFFLYEDQLPAFQAIIKTQNGSNYPVRLIFDSGAGFTSSLTTNFIAKHNLDSELKVKVQIPVIGGAQSSASLNYLSSLKQLRFGNYSFNHIPVNFSTTNSGASATDSIDGVIGFDLIKRFNVVLDYENKFIKLIPNKHFRSEFDFNLTGLNLRTKDNQVVVFGVMDFSPAKSAGIKEGDLVISVDGKSFTSSADLRNYLKGSHKTKTFVIKRGGELLQIAVKPDNFY